MEKELMQEGRTTWRITMPGIVYKEGGLAKGRGH